MFEYKWIQIYIQESLNLESQNCSKIQNLRNKILNRIFKKIEKNNIHL